MISDRHVRWWPLGSDIIECVVDDVRYKYHRIGRGLIVSTCTEGTVTPEQAIAATVAKDLFIHGPEMNEQTCTVESMHGFTDAHVSTRYFVELSCHTIDDWGDSEPPKFCPYCGRKVIDQDARDLLDAIASDDGRRYSMQEVMDLMEGE